MYIDKWSIIELVMNDAHFIETEWRIYASVNLPSLVQITVCLLVGAIIGGHYLHQCWNHDGVIKWKHFPRYWPFVRGIHGSPVNFSHKGHWRGALMLSVICSLNKQLSKKNCEVGYLRRHRAHYDVIVMYCEMVIEIRILSFKKIHLKLSFMKLRPFCLGLKVLS